MGSSQNELATFSEFIRLLLEILNSMVNSKNLGENYYLVYWLVHSKSTLLPFKGHDRLWELVENLIRVTDHFESGIIRSGLSLSDSTFEQVLRVSFSLVLCGWVCEWDRR